MAARRELRHLIGRDPRACGHHRARWTLALIRTSCPWLSERTIGGVARILKRFGIRWKRARWHIHSPDPHYQAKLTEIARVRALPPANTGAIVVLYMDEFTVLRQPTLAQAYAAVGNDQPLAERSVHADTETRVVGTLDATTARVVYRRASKITIETLVTFLHDVRAAYPHAERIYIIQDNWPVHIHPDVLVALEPQETPFTRTLPASWSPTASARAIRKWGNVRLPIQLVPLPTYASWCNPIEKLWRKVRQEHVHVHRLAGDLTKLREVVDTALTSFAYGSEELLHYVGLKPCTD